MKKLPIGIQSIEKILEKGDYVYIDKTPFALQLIDGGAPHYFFSRPRRFGKSLFVSTLKEIFLGNKALFQGYAIYDSDYDWQPHPVLHFDFSALPNETPQELKDSLKRAIAEMATEHGLEIQVPSVQEGLTYLVKALAKTNRVVVLLDEYDKPIIDHLDQPTTAAENRKLLRPFFGTLKSLEAHIRFTFITGIAKFSKVSLFSEANHLQDITMHPQYATMLGYTEEELRQHFEAHIQAIAQERCAKGQATTDEEVLAEIKYWYNGYRFSKEETHVYNPFSTLNFLDEKDPKSYWYDSGTPSFLAEEVKKHPEAAVPLSGTSAEESVLMDMSSLEELDLTALMFQTGYLTITDYNAASQHYHLDFPNEEVRQAFTRSLIKQFAKLDTDTMARSRHALQAYDLGAFFVQIERALASFPYQLFTEAQERTYHGLVLSLMQGMGLEVSAERANNLGRVDLLVEVPKATYVIELKLDQSAEAALAQIKEKQYHVPHLNQGKEVAIVGLNFSSKTRNVAGWCGELLNKKGELVRVLTATQAH